MKEGKQECAKPPPCPKPNFKNKDFIKWSKSESCKKDDNIVSTDWHEKLQRTPLFTPVYDNAPSNMVYLLSGEYGRMWQKERDEWYTKVFVLNPKEQDMKDRRKKIQKQAKEAKKAAELSIQERKARKAKEAEAKAKADAEKAEKLKAKLQKCAAKKKPKTKKQETKTDEKPLSASKQPPTEESKNDGCPNGWMPLELTVQCECSHHSEENPNVATSPTDPVPPAREETKNQGTENDEQPHERLTMCEDYIQKLADINEGEQTPRSHCSQRD